MPLEPGNLLNNRYRVTRLLERGSPGAVYLALDEDLGTPCVIREAPNPSPEAERHFRREAARLAGLRHRCLPRITNHFAGGDRQYLVSDFVEGEDLQQRLARQGPLPVRLVLQWVGPLCDALSYLHGLVPPIVHRDIRPANIKITLAGEVCLVGLGGAGPAAEPAAAADAPAAGTWPPEQHGFGRSDARLDQYALAASLYTVLTGQPPPNSVERLRGNAALIPPQALRPEVSPSLAAALTRALALAPDDRFANVDAFRHALLSAPPPDAETTAAGRRAEPPPAASAPRGPADAALARPPTALPPGPQLSPHLAQSDPLDTLEEAPLGPLPEEPLPPPFVILPPEPQGPPAPAARPRWLLPVGLGCGLLLLITLAVGGGSALGVFLAAPGATATASPSRTAVAVAAQATRTAVPSQTRAAAATTAPSRTPTLLVPTETPVPSATGTESAAPQPSPTPTLPGTPIGSGGRLAFISDRDGQFFQVYTMNVDGSDVRQLTTDPADKWSPAWAFNGTQLAWSPDGARLLYVAEGVDGDTDIWMIDAEGGTPQNLTSAAGDDFQPHWCQTGAIWFASTRTNGIHQIFSTTLDRLAQGLRPVNFSATHNSPREFDPAPYPGCERLMFTSTLDGPNEIWRYWPDCAACYRKVRSLKAQGGRAEEPALSPDGRLLAYTRVLADTAEIVLADVEDAASNVQLTGSLSNFSAQWSPDGQWLAFVSLRDGNREVYVMGQSGDGQTNLTQNSATDTDPAWQPTAP